MFVMPRAVMAAAQAMHACTLGGVAGTSLRRAR